MHRYLTIRVNGSDRCIGCAPGYRLCFPFWGYRCNKGERSSVGTQCFIRFAELNSQGFQKFFRGSVGCAIPIGIVLGVKASPAALYQILSGSSLCMVHPGPISTTSREGQKPNISIFPTLEVSKDERFTEKSEEQLSNMAPISVTLEVLNEDTSTVRSDAHSRNIEFISVTLEVSKEDRFTEVSEGQKENIPVIRVTLLVLKFERSSEVSEEQLENIPDILTTFEVSRLLSPSIDFRLFKLPNMS